MPTINGARKGNSHNICSFPFLDDGVGIDPQCFCIFTFTAKNNLQGDFTNLHLRSLWAKLYLVKSASSDGAHGYVGKICGLS